MASIIDVTARTFFDRQKVIRAMDRKTHRVLSATGAFARTVMRRGMRRTPAISQPGHFPHAHAGQLRDLIFFSYEPRRKAAVTGPTLFAGSRDSAIRTQTVPNLVNIGGFARRFIRRLGRWVVQRYRPRPFVTLTRDVAVRRLRDNMERFNLT